MISQFIIPYSLFDILNFLNFYAEKCSNFISKAQRTLKFESF